MKKPYLIFFILVFISGTSIFAQNILYVDVNYSGAVDGYSWAKPFIKLQNAIDAANDGDEIWVAEGANFPTSRDRSGNENPANLLQLTFFIDKDVTILGGFERGDNLSDRDPVSKLTILSGKIKQFNVYQVVNIRDCDAVVNGFTITGGVAAGNSSIDEDKGGGMAIYTISSDAAPQIEQCIFTGNQSSNNGGAVYVATSSGGEVNPTFSRCRFDQNTSGSSAGAVSIKANKKNLNPTFINCIFFDNFGDASAGAVSAGSSNNAKVNANFYYCDFVKNDCDLFGAAIRLVPASGGGLITANVYNSIFL